MFLSNKRIKNNIYTTLIPLDTKTKLWIKRRLSSNILSLYGRDINFCTLGNISELLNITVNTLKWMQKNRHLPEFFCINRRSQGIYLLPQVYVIYAYLYNLKYRHKVKSIRSQMYFKYYYMMVLDCNKSLDRYIRRLNK